MSVLLNIKFQAHYISKMTSSEHYTHTVDLQHPIYFNLVAPLLD